MSKSKSSISIKKITNNNNNKNVIENDKKSDNKQGFFSNFNRMTTKTTNNTKDMILKLSNKMSKYQSFFNKMVERAKELNIETPEI